MRKVVHSTTVLECIIRMSKEGKIYLWAGWKGIAYTGKSLLILANIKMHYWYESGQKDGTVDWIWKDIAYNSTGFFHNI